MSKFMFLLAVVMILGLTFLVIGCGSEKEDILSTSDKDSSNDAPLKDIPTSVTSESGDKFTISFESNPTTGYSWFAETDPEFVKVADEKFTANSNLIGAAGVQTFIFQSLKAGQTKITLSYMRPWEKESIDKHEIAVTIKP
jgi:inhibitor of cysteine peptidase